MTYGKDFNRHLKFVLESGHRIAIPHKSMRWTYAPTEEFATTAVETINVSELLKHVIAELKDYSDSLRLTIEAKDGRIRELEATVITLARLKEREE